MALQVVLAASGWHKRTQSPGARPCLNQGQLLCHLLPPLQAAALWLTAAASSSRSHASKLLHLQTLIACAAPIVAAVLTLPPVDSLLHGRVFQNPRARRYALAAAAAFVSLALTVFSKQAVASLATATPPASPRAAAAAVTAATARAVHWPPPLRAALAAAACAAIAGVQRAALRHLPRTFTVGEAWLLASGAVHATLWLLHRAAITVATMPATSPFHDAPQGAPASDAHAMLAAVLRMDALPVLVVITTVAVCCAVPASVRAVCASMPRVFARARGAMNGERGHEDEGGGVGQSAPKPPRLFTNLIGMDGELRDDLLPPSEDEADGGTSEGTSEGTSQGTSDEGSESSDDDGAHEQGGTRLAHRIPSAKQLARRAKAVAARARGAIRAIRHTARRKLPSVTAAPRDAAIVAAYATTMGLAARAALAQIVGHSGRAATVAGWATAIAAALPMCAALEATHTLHPSLLRKAFHLIALAIFAPVLARDPALLSLGLGVAIALLIIAELLRSADAPVVAPALRAFYARFMDARDGGAITVSHLSLLLGIAAPLWMALEYGEATRGIGAAADSAVSGGGTLGGLDMLGASTDGRAAAHADARLLDNYRLPDGHPAAAGGAASDAAVAVGLAAADAAAGAAFATTPPAIAAWAGLLALGVADTAAAAAGIAFGRHRVFAGAHKTIEGAIAAVVALCASFVVVAALGWAHFDLGPGLLGWWRLLWVCVLTCSLEAVTLQLDNLVVPLQASILCMLLLR